MPIYEANMDYIPPSPPTSIKQCNKSDTVKFHMELLLTTTTRRQSRSGETPDVDYITLEYFFCSFISFCCENTLFNGLILVYIPDNHSTRPQVIRNYSANGS